LPLLPTTYKRRTPMVASAPSPFAVGPHQRGYLTRRWPRPTAHLAAGVCRLPLPPCLPSAICPVSLSEEASGGGAAVTVVVETDACSHMGAVVEAAFTAATTTGAGAPPGVGEQSRWPEQPPKPPGELLLLRLRRQWRRWQPLWRWLLLLSMRRLLLPGGGRAAHCCHYDRVAAPHLPQAVCNGRQFLAVLNWHRKNARSTRWAGNTSNPTSLFSLLSSTSSPRDFAVFLWSNWA
jgi:hypothetical protein